MFVSQNPHTSREGHSGLEAQCGRLMGELDGPACPGEDMLSHAAIQRTQMHNRGTPGIAHLFRPLENMVFRDRN